MERYESIEKGIEEHDVKKLRVAIAGISYTCRDFSDGEFDKAVKYVESKGIKLKDDQLVGNPTISSKKSIYTEDDFTRAIFELKKNFCDERIEDVKKIGKSLYGGKREEVKRAPDIKEKSNEIYPKVQDHQSVRNKIMFAVLVVIIIVILIIYILTTQKN